MRLNPDCIRKLLFYFEENTSTRPIICNPTEISQEIEFDVDTTEYHIRQCEYHGFFIGYRENVNDYNFYLEDISPSAHEFLANIRSDTIWKKIKNVAFQIGVSSLPSLIQLSEKFVTQLIQTHIVQ